MPRLVQMLLFGLRTVPFMERCRRRYGDAFTVSLLETEPSVWVSDPAAIETLYSRDRENRVPPGTKPALEPMFGRRSVFFADGAAHRRKRQLLMPPFHGERMAAWRERMIDAADREIDTWPVGEEFALAPRMAAVTEDVIFEVVFGLGAGEHHARLRRALSEMVDAAMRPAGVLLGFIERGSWSRRLPLTPWGRLQRKIDSTHRLLLDEIERRRSDPELERREDILSLLVQARDERGAPMSDEELRDELMSLLLAGAESSGTTMAFAFDFLLHHSDARERLSSELELGQEPYLEAVIQETMRLRPVPHLTARQLASPLEVGGYPLPAGTTVVVPAYVLHHRPDLYPDPTAFRPERFLDRPPGAFTWVPFGGGARRCVGASFATLEMKCVISAVLRRVSMRSAAGEPERVRMRNIILTPARGTRVVVERVEPPVQDHGGMPALAAATATKGSPVSG
jgi:cytochrome P450 family 135